MNQTYMLAVNNLIHHTMGSDYKRCTGCAACAAVCPTESIAMLADDEGFLQPTIDMDSCTDCGLCREICPAIRLQGNRLPATAGDADKDDDYPIVWAAWNLDESIRRHSSSGGIFTVLAENVLARAGVVVGAAFDEGLVVRHEIVDSVEDLHRLRGSKYVQSEICPSLYHEVKKLLSRRPVLFSGTPCQVAALRSQLGKEYENLYCCDLICHGVPSPSLFKNYFEAKSPKNKKVENIFFRDKLFGWKNFSVSWQLNKGKRRSFGPMLQDPYMAAFLRNVALRWSCYTCSFTNIVRQGDLTIADFWGVAKKYPEYDKDDKGTSLVLVNNLKGKAWLESCKSKLFLGIADIDTAVAGNPMLVRPANCPPERKTFYHDLNGLEFDRLIRKYRLHGPLFHQRVIGFLKRRIKKAILAVAPFALKKG